MILWSTSSDDDDVVVCSICLTSCGSDASSIGALGPAADVAAHAASMNVCDSSSSKRRVGTVVDMMIVSALLERKNATQMSSSMSTAFVAGNQSNETNDRIMM